MQKIDKRTFQGAAVAFVVLSLLSATARAGAADDVTFSGNASWYGIPFHGKKTASGEIFDMNKLTSAHKTLPLSTKVLVENPKNGKSAVVRVNDRGPYVKTRVMDLSRKGADNLGYLSHGTAHLDFTVIGKNAKIGAPDATKKEGAPDDSTKPAAADDSKKDTAETKKEAGTPDATKKDAAAESNKKETEKKDGTVKQPSKDADATTEKRSTLKKIEGIPKKIEKLPKKIEKLPKKLIPKHKSKAGAAKSEPT